MIRRYHRWLATIFGVFLIWISVTGLLSQLGGIVNKGGLEGMAPERAAPALPAGFICPETMTCRPKPAPTDWNVSLLHHLHSGEQFGPVGQLISIFSGLSLFFFAISGLYMYIQMWRGRLVRTEAGKMVRGGRWFW